MTTSPSNEPVSFEGPAASALANAYLLEITGESEKAVSLYHQAITLDPDLPNAQASLGRLLMRMGRLDEAAACLQHAIALEPDNQMLPAFLGNTCVLAGKLDLAVEYFRHSLALDPHTAMAIFGLGNVARLHGKLNEAIEHFRALVDVEPDSPSANNILASALAEQGRLDEAANYFRAAIALAPDFAEARLGLATLLQNRQSSDEALRQYRRIAELQPNSPQALGNLGTALAQQGHIEEALDYFHRSLSLDPGNALMHNNMATALLGQNRLAEAAASYRRALAIDPDLMDAHYGLGDALTQQRRPDEAIASYRTACALQPDFAMAHAGLGNALQETGQFDAARACYEQAIALEPNAPRYYLALTRVTKLAADSPYLRAMLRMATDMSQLNETGKAVLHFALGYALADKRESFEHIVTANAIIRRTISYDEGSVLAGHERIAEIFTPGFMRSHESGGDPSQLPVFIVGMPRSGTTLVEQILASHPNVFGADESHALSEALDDLTPNNRFGPHFMDGVTDWSSDQFHQLAGDYLNRLPATAGQSRAARVTRITDKMMLNYLYVGFIRLALPNARIIHVSRDPVDTCLSCFSILFNELPFVYDLGELGRRYRAYEKLMTHWRSLLPPQAMLEVRYEDLVNHTERETRRMIDYCGLEWDEACLRFYQTERPLGSASNMHVRQPIYRSSVGRWRPDRATLKPLLDALFGD